MVQTIYRLILMHLPGERKKVGTIGGMPYGFYRKGSTKIYVQGLPLQEISNYLDSFDKVIR